MRYGPQITYLILLLCPFAATGQQVPDANYLPEIISPAYPEGEGPWIMIDEGHHNFHTRDGRYMSFARLLERDGYNTAGYKGRFTDEGLSQCRILVISNALNEQNVENWYKPVYSAFSEQEISILKNWVGSGGSLFLIADHMPLAGAAAKLAAAFGFEFTDGFVMEPGKGVPTMFSLEDQGLITSMITQGRNESERVQRVATFTGQAFKYPEGASEVIHLPGNMVNLLPDTAWVFNENTTRMSAEGWSQGAYMEFGQGRLVFFGEAAMFSAQLAGPDKIPMGMNHPEANENYQLLLNIIHWLDKLY